MAVQQGNRQAIHSQLEQAGFLPPDYQGGTLASIPATAAALLEVPFAGLPAVARESLATVGRGCPQRGGAAH